MAFSQFFLRKKKKEFQVFGCNEEVLALEKLKHTKMLQQKNENSWF